MAAFPQTNTPKHKENWFHFTFLKSRLMKHGSMVNCLSYTHSWKLSWWKKQELVQRLQHKGRPQIQISWKAEQTMHGETNTNPKENTQVFSAALNSVIFSVHLVNTSEDPTHMPCDKFNQPLYQHVNTAGRTNQVQCIVQFVATHLGKYQWGWFTTTGLHDCFQDLRVMALGYLPASLWVCG